VPKSILETEKTLKTLSSGQIYKNNPKNPQKNKKKSTRLGLKKNGFFPTLFDTDPDPAFLAEYRSGSGVFRTKNLKIYS
jgi:hypothetical protein